MPIHWTAVYVLWRREMPRYVRAKSRIAGSPAMPVLFLGAYFFEKSEAVRTAAPGLSPGARP